MNQFRGITINQNVLNMSIAKGQQHNQLKQQKDTENNILDYSEIMSLLVFRLKTTYFILNHYLTTKQ